MFIILYCRNNVENRPILVLLGFIMNFNIHIDSIKWGLVLGSGPGVSFLKSSDVDLRIYLKVTEVTYSAVEPS